MKMNRRATHFGDISIIGTFCERVRTLGERLGPILCSYRRPGRATTGGSS